MKHTKKKVLCTGGAGFIGSHIVDELIDRGYDVIVIDNLSVGERKNVNPKATFVKGDIRDEQMVRAFMNNVDAVYHFAYDATECKSIFSPVLNADINIKGGLVVLKEAINAGVEKFVFPSSCLVYGKPQELPIPEVHERIPNDPYSVTKMAFEEYLRIYYELGKIKPYIVRFNNTYGPRLRLDNPYKGVTQIFISKAFKHQNPCVFGKDDSKRAFTYVEDLKKPLVDIIDKPELINSPINFGTNETHTITDMAQIVIDLIDPTLKIDYLPPREKDIKNSYIAVNRMKLHFGKIPDTTLIEGLKKTIEWARGQNNEFKYDWPVEIPSLLDDKYGKRQI